MVVLSVVSAVAAGAQVANTNPAPFYANWTFWSFVVAAVAVLLSQFPPLNILLRRAKVEVDAYDRLNVTHWMGNPQIRWLLQLRNAGGSRVKVESAKLTVSNESGKLCELPAMNLEAADGKTGGFLFTRFFLDPDEERSAFAAFYPPFGRKKERDSREIVKAIRQDIEKKHRDLVEAGDEPKSPIEAAPELVEPAIACFNSKFIWLEGEYSIRLSVVCEPKRASVNRDYRFVLFESDVQDLKERTDRYKYGKGVCYDDDELAEVNPRVSDVDSEAT